ncbi:MAG TPA: response regulator transcription factor, partial [Ktedonobacterales bacterium]|nr:response regulator transcription factor [Ktedonobacterales bacterium]
MTQDRTRILVADDHPIVREGLVAILETQPDFDVVGQAATGGEAVRLATTVMPDILLLDLELPELDGVEVLRQVRAQCPSMRVLIFTAFDTDERIVGAVRAGASGYLLKGAPRQDIFRAIRVLRAGGSLLEPVVAAKLMRSVTHEIEPNASDALTAREQEVLRLLARGL